MLTFTTDPRTKFVPVTVIVKAGPLVATISGEIELIVGFTPVPMSGTTIVPTPGIVTFRFAVSPGSVVVEAVNERPILQRLPWVGRLTGPTRGEHAGGGAFTEGATIEKSPGLLPPEILKVAMLSAVVPAFSSVPSISVATPTGTVPKLTGVGLHPVRTQKFPFEVKNSGNVTGPLINPKRSRNSVSLSGSASLTVSVAKAEPGMAPLGAVNVSPNQQVPLAAIDAAVPVGAKAQIAVAGGAGGPGVPVGATIVKSLAFKPLITAEPAISVSDFGPIFFN